jgi:hypothetical protein
MPPAAVKSIRDLIFWQYAKIISEAAGPGKRGYRFVMNRFKKLQTGEIQWSGSIREYIRERELPDQCIYCGATHNLSYDHLIPLSKGGPDSPDNVVLACRSCNASKGDRGPYEWFGLDRRYDLPRIVEGKFLKLAYQYHEKEGTLDLPRSDIQKLCQRCSLGHLCPETDLSVLCLEAIFG